MNIYCDFYSLLFIKQDNPRINHLNILLFFKELLIKHLYLVSFYYRHLELKFSFILFNLWFFHQFNYLLKLH